jgi:hypothetical protein
MKGIHGFLYFLVVSTSGFLDGLVFNYFFDWKVATRTGAIWALVGSFILGVLVASLIATHYEVKSEARNKGSDAT